LGLPAHKIGVQLDTQQESFEAAHDCLLDLGMQCWQLDLDMPSSVCFFCLIAQKLLSSCCKQKVSLANLDANCRNLKKQASVYATLVMLQIKTFCCSFLMQISPATK